jgi:hypothetical protein
MMRPTDLNVLENAVKSITYVFCRTHDGLEREFRFFNRLEAPVCTTTCAPADQQKSHRDQCGIASRHGRNAGNYRLWPKERTSSLREKLPGSANTRLSATDCGKSCRNPGTGLMQTHCACVLIREPIRPFTSCTVQPSGWSHSSIKSAGAH